MEDGSLLSPKGPRFRVLLLGPFALERGDVPIDVGKWQRRVEVLFKLLATAPDLRRSRDELVDVLWPDAAPDAGAGNLRILVHRLRLVLGGEPSPVLTERGWIALNPAYTWESDLDRFEDLVRTAGTRIGVLEEAASLYRGQPLIEDIYEDWSTSVRDRAQRTWHELCTRLADLYRSRGSYDNAARWFERMLDNDPIDEEALRGLIVVMSQAGRRSDALRRYRQFEQRLRQELDATPADETLAVVEHIKARHEIVPTEVVEPVRPEPVLPTGKFLGALPDGPLIGREEDLERIQLSMDAVDGGSGRLVLLAGERGIGKTRIAQEVMLRLRERGFTVTTGRCHQRNRGELFSPFVDILASAYTCASPSIRQRVSQRWPQVGWLLPDQMDPAPEVAGEQDEQQHLLRAVTGFLQALTEEHPLAILLDDLQWADEGSMDMLLYLVHRSRDQRLFILGTYRDADVDRDHPLHAAVQDLAREGLVERVRVRRLSMEETAALVRATVGEMEEAEGFLEFVHRRTKGNPFFIEEMVHGLGGHYRLVRQIGAGGMGRVFEAIDTRSDERVAAKIMFARTEGDPRALLRFRQEGEVLASLVHPNIVKVHGTFLEERASCIVMELLDGRSLGQMLNGEPLDLQRTAHLLRQVAAALACAHDCGIVHRDIKPDNIMVVGDDHVKVTDFGIARLMRPVEKVTTLTSTGMTMGTPLYMAPEQIEGKKVDGRTDLYSLGAVLYQMVTGRPPFQADDPVTIAFKHVHEAPEPPSTLNPALPEAWETLILKALAKEPADRFQSAQALERALERLEAGEDAPEDAGEGLDAAATSTNLVLRDPHADRLPVVQHSGSSRSELVGTWRRFPRRALVGSVAALVAALGTIGLASGHMSVAFGPFAVQSASRSALAWQRTTGSGPGQFHGPTGLAVNAQGNVFVVDQGNARFQEISPNGVPKNSWGSKGIGPLQFDSPVDLAIGPQGTIYVTDGGTNDASKRIEKIRSGLGQFDQIPFDGGALAVDRHANLYVTDYYNHQIQEFSPTDAPARPIPIDEVEVGNFPFPAGIAIDANGTIYVADRQHNRIERIPPSGQRLPPIGASATGRRRLNIPTDVALDVTGNIYVADAGNNRIEKFSQAGKFLGSWGSRGTGLGQFIQPSSLAVDADGNIYVSDYYNNRVQKFSPSGKPLWATRGNHPQKS